MWGAEARWFGEGFEVVQKEDKVENDLLIVGKVSDVDFVWGANGPRGSKSRKAKYWLIPNRDELVFWGETIRPTTLEIFVDDGAKCRDDFVEPNCEDSEMLETQQWNEHQNE